MAENPEKATVSSWALFISCVWSGVGAGLVAHSYATDNNFTLNLLGDFLAGWFSPLAFSWFIYAVFMQRDELVEARKVAILQNKELAETRKVTQMQAQQLELQKKELEGSKVALEDQSKALNLQNFENIFFSLVTSLTRVIDSMDISEICKGRAVFTYSVNNIRRYFKGDSSSFANQYDSYWNQAGEHLGIYFRLLFRIVKFVDEHNYPNILGKRKYVKLLRSHLSEAELGLLFINSMDERGARFTRFIIKYDLVDNLVPDTLPLGYVYFQKHLEKCKMASDAVNKLIKEQEYKDIKNEVFLKNIEDLCEVSLNVPM